MTLSALFGYLIFAFLTTITPGPNNLVLFNNGKVYGVRASINLMTGVITGFFTLLCVTGYGVGSLITQNIYLAMILKIAGSFWLLYLGYSMMHLNINPDITYKNLGLKEGYLLQFVNPKGWIMAVSGAGAFMPHFGNLHVNVLIFAGIFALVGIPSMLSWVYLGDSISRLIKSKKANKILGWGLFLLMILSVVMIWRE
ncbi:MAG: LysE family translocator [Candidatus Margulisbacteria bacterium]|nr:LysE family translocator [Candidatus Margulisiibacteriota bacterium]